jgi:hypothetical protein
MMMDEEVYEQARREKGYYAVYCRAYLRDSSEEYRVIGREPDRSMLEWEFENAEEIPHRREEIGRTETEVEWVFTAPQKFWVVAKKETRWGTSYEVFEARGPFPDEGEAKARVLREGRLSLLFG